MRRGRLGGSGCVLSRKSSNLKVKCFISERRKRLPSLPCTQHLYIRNVSQTHLFLFRFHSTFVLTQRQVEPRCFLFLGAVLVILLTTQRATIERVHMCNDPRLLLLVQMKVNCTDTSSFKCTSSLMQLGRRLRKRTQNKLDSSQREHWEREQTCRLACTCKFPVGSTYCSQELVQTCQAASPFLLLTSASFEYPDKPWLQVRGHGFTESPHMQALRSLRESFIRRAGDHVCVFCVPAG